MRSEAHNSAALAEIGAALEPAMGAGVLEVELAGTVRYAVESRDAPSDTEPRLAAA